MSNVTINVTLVEKRDPKDVGEVIRKILEEALKRQAEQAKGFTNQVKFEELTEEPSSFAAKEPLQGRKPTYEELEAACNAFEKRIDHMRNVAAIVYELIRDLVGVGYKNEKDRAVLEEASATLRPLAALDRRPTPR